MTHSSLKLSQHTHTHTQATNDLNILKAPHTPLLTEGQTHPVDIVPDAKTNRLGPLLTKPTCQCWSNTVGAEMMAAFSKARRNI